MKIAFLSFYSGIVARGVETFVHELANRLTDRGFDITVYQSGSKLPGAKYNVVTIQIPIDWNHKGSFFPRAYYFSGKIRKFTNLVLSHIDKDTDIIFPTNGQWQVAMCSIWAKLRRKKIVVSGQSGHGFDDRINLYSFPDRFVVLTEAQKKWARKVNPKVKIEKIPNGVDINKFNKKGEAYDFGLPHPVILYTGAFDYWKRQTLAIKAVALLGRGSLALVGTGLLKDKLQELGDRLLPGRFKIINFAHTEMPKIYRGADLFTYSTATFESFGIVMVEAMASGLGIVATNDPMRKEIIGDAGILVDPTDTAAYAKALQKALATNWGNKPRKQAEKFSWDEIAKKYAELFKDINS